MESKRGASFDQSRPPAGAASASASLADAFAAQRAHQASHRAAPPAAFGGAAPPFFQRGNSAVVRGPAVDPFSIGKTTYRGIPLGAVQAQAEVSARGPLQHVAQRPVYRSLSPGTFDASQPVYRSLGGMGGMGGGTVGLSRGPVSADAFGAPKLNKMSLASRKSAGMGGGSAYMPSTRTPDPFGDSMMIGNAFKSMNPANPAVTTKRASSSVGPEVDVRSAINSPGVVPPELPGPPFYLERAHFYSKKSAQQVVGAIEQHFKTSQQADVSFDPVKCKWKIDLYINNHQLRIIGRIYAVSARDMVVVEFNRRKGESFAFCGWYRELSRQLVARSLICDKSGSDTPLDMAFARARRHDPVPIVQKDCLQPLLEMASTTFAETQAEAAREVANLSNTEANRAQIVAAGFLQPLVKLLASRDSNVHRCAAVAVANIAESSAPEVKAQLQSAVFAPGCLDALCQMLREEKDATGCCRCDMESKRASARALANLISGGACSGHVGQPHRELLHRVLKGCSDERLRAQCGRALSACRA